MGRGLLDRAGQVRGADRRLHLRDDQGRGPAPHRIHHAEAVPAVPLSARRDGPCGHVRRGPRPVGHQRQGGGPSGVHAPGRDRPGPGPGVSQRRGQRGGRVGAGPCAARGVGVHGVQDESVPGGHRVRALGPGLQSRRPVFRGRTAEYARQLGVRLRSPRPDFRAGPGPAARQRPGPLRSLFLRRAAPPRAPARLVPAAVADAGPAGHGRVAVHPFRIPRAHGRAGRRHHPAGHLRVRRPARDAQDRGDRRGALRHHGAAQPHGTRGHGRQRALRGGHAQFQDPRVRPARGHGMGAVHHRSLPARRRVPAASRHARSRYRRR